MKTPKPKTLKVVCDVCGLDWAAHGEKPTLEKCVELLRAELAELAKLAKLAKPRTFELPRPNPFPWVPMPQPIGPYRPYIQPNTSSPRGPYFGGLGGTSSTLV